jgi:hypothetical protein
VNTVEDLCSLAVVGALSTWLGQVWATRISQTAQHKQQLQLDSLRARVDAELQDQKTHAEKQIFVHRVQFEKEFCIYVELWSVLVEARRATLGLRPMFDHVALDQAEEDRRRVRIEKFVAAYNAFLEVVDKHRPFIAGTVHASCLKILDLANDESDAYRYATDTHERQYWQESKKNAERFKDLVDEVSDTIQRRISSMAVGDESA